ncbi:MAG: hypothetical protein LBT40_09920 [Deltaproteobacteria bacterium]|nr:hypothetical protein [Deltaproteobacteria bacterium]
MSRILFLLGGTALGLLAPKLVKLAKEFYDEHHTCEPDLFRKRRCRTKTSDEARREAETANPGTPPEPAEEPAV